MSKMTDEVEVVPLVAVTRLFPLPGKLATENPDVAPRLVTGFDVGPFFVHMALSDDEKMYFSDGPEDAGYWHVTHLGSCFAVQKRIPSHVRAIWLARKLAEIGDWPGETRDAVLAAITAEQVAQISVLRADALSGDCQGATA